MTTVEYARGLTDRIKVAVEGTWHLIAEAYQSRAWSALGYSSWDDYCTREFGTSRLRLPREDRAEMVQSLRASGLSLRAIGAATGNSKQTIIEDLRPSEVVQIGPPDPAGFEVDYETGEVLDPPSDDHVLTEAECEALDQANGTRTPTPPPIIGTDGKSYPKQAPRTTPRKPLVDVAKTRGFALREAMDAVVQIAQDNRYRTNERQVADVLRGHLLYVAETVAAVLDQQS